ncbi:bifunctional endoribonuclease/protein kinase ire1 [Marasmius crinis-equi]|uniref:Bifunctional endoribonuclease/protein kinase ire1 n=1 Tax=Marasmius crinis-equi TaxID=585013 RepID=A0ABR3FE31_9AGAR
MYTFIFALTQAIRMPQPLYLTSFLLLFASIYYATFTSFSLRSNADIEAAEPLWAHHDLVDTILVVSADGTFHALNRTSGHLFWSMSSDRTRQPTPNLTPNPGTLANNGESKHAGVATPELYVEPRTGDIYMDPLFSPFTRFGSSMPELVDMTPFAYSESDYHQIFVGKKETKLVLVELENGLIREFTENYGMQGADAPAESAGREDGNSPIINLDELEGITLEAEKPTEVRIGRTDYHVSVHTRTSNTTQATAVQDLTFSNYGPNNQHHLFQKMYTRTGTKDDKYVVSLPGGEILAFQSMAGDKNLAPSKKEIRYLWMYELRSSSIAVFDIFKSHARTPGSSDAYVLLQPPPSPGLLTAAGLTFFEA